MFQFPQPCFLGRRMLRVRGGRNCGGLRGDRRGRCCGGLRGRCCGDRRARVQRPRNRGRRRRAWSAVACARLQAIVVLRRAFDGAAFGKGREHLRALFKMGIARLRARGFAHLRSLRPGKWSGGAATENQRHRCGRIFQSALPPSFRSVPNPWAPRMTELLYRQAFSELPASFRLGSLRNGRDASNWPPRTRWKEPWPLLRKPAVADRRPR